ncbi:MAG TPA: 23S rRNA (adenine(2503)-C(2))-methyltransferase RlmN [Thermoanaerobaculia bacterium]|nr:23S rRNA (adenine(2503)-C(2))-methyltransferase RlmN [Thermoanaerobaculia bacterium]
MRDPRPPLLGLSRGELTRQLGPWLDRPFRGEQIYRALYEQGVTSLEGITTLSRAQRAELAARYRVGIPEVAERHRSADGTEKLLLRLVDGATVEAVDIPDARRRTLCLSSQAGCALGCRFCVTGYWGAGRDLDAGEILGQVLALRGRLQRRDSLNLVFMGMGEPLLNLEAVAAALSILSEWISWRRITVSTVGVLPGILAMAGWEQRPNLAISLHAPDDERRTAIMPVNRAYPLADLMEALRAFPLERGRRLTFEYILIADFNDSPRDADDLARRLRGLRGKVNLIPLNPDPVLGERMAPPSPARVEAFRRRLQQRGMVATVRRRRGDDVSAACGQLRAFGRDPRGFRRSNVSW